MENVQKARGHKKSRVSRGYRLKSTTHDLLKNLQLITGEDCDSIIEDSCRMYYAHYIQKLEEIRNNSNSSKKTKN
jgi:hypothetical protein